MTKFNAIEFFNAGAGAFVQDQAEAIILACGEDQVDQALHAYVLGYTAKGLAKGGKITDKHKALAETLIANGVNPDAKTTPEGKVKRTKEQHDLIRAGARRFNRVRARLNVKPKDQRGGARERDKSPKVLKNPKVTSATDAMAHVRNMAMMLSTFCAKNKDQVSSDVSTCVADFVATINRLAK